MDDFPKATPLPASTPNKETPPAKELTLEEKQLVACKKVISKLTTKYFSGCVKFTQPLEASVLKKIEESGFEVATSDYYATNAGHDVKVTITDPGLRTASVEQGKEKISQLFSGGINSSGGMNKELQEGLTSLVDAFLGPGGKSNITSFQL
jgi:hypothetical protein